MNLFMKYRTFFINYYNNFSVILLFVLISAFNVYPQEKVVETIRLDYNGKVIAPPRAMMPYREVKRPRIGLALSGGGMRGVAQIGVLKVLEENDIPIDYIVGTSIGAVIGGLYASGYTPDEIWEITRSFDWGQALNDNPERSSQLLGEKQKRSRAIIQFRLENMKLVLPEALSPGQNLGDFITNLILNAPYHSYQFDHLKIPLRIITTDILTGTKVVVDRGDLAAMIRASISIPLLFNPVKSDSLLLVDGGVLDNIPVDVTRNTGADIVLAVNTTSPLRKQSDLLVPWEMADQVTTIMQIPHNEQQLNHADFVVSLADIYSTSANQNNVDSLYQEGIRRGTALLADIRAKYNELDNQKNRERLIYVHEIKANDDSLLPFNLNTLANRHVSEQEIIDVLENAHNSGSFRDVYAEIKKQDDKTILVYTFEPFPVLERVSLLGQTIFHGSELQSIFSPLLFKPMNHFECTRALEQIIEMYREKDYSLAEISNISFSKESGHAIITISEGKISSLNFEGNEHVRDFLLYNEFTLHPQDVFQNNLAKAGIENIYGTGLFNSVSLKIAPGTSGYHLNIRLQEKATNVIRYGFRYDDERWGRSFLEFAEENMLGVGNDLTLHMQYGERDKKFAAEYRIDRIFNTYFTARFNLYNTNQKFFTYDKSESISEYWRHSTGANINVGQHIERFGTLSGFFRVEEIDIDAVSGSDYTIDTGALTINTIGINSIIDTRDRIPFPRSGKFHEFQYEVSTGDFLGSDISYYKVYNRLSNYFTLADRHTFSPLLFWGTSDVSTPYSEQFQLGGFGSFYGLRENSMHGRHVILTSMEYRLFINTYWMFDTFLTLRFDFGAVWEKDLIINGSDFVNGRGLALSFQTPIGPLSIAYGQANTRDERVYISAGYEF